MFGGGWRLKARPCNMIHCVINEPHTETHFLYVTDGISRPVEVSLVGSEKVVQFLQG